MIEPAASAAVGPGHCADCGAPTGGNYCPRCGQETRIETPTARQFVLEFLDQYVALEGKLGRTLKVLILHPGQLTLDYLRGRRQRYVRPLKLYLTISVLFFGIIGVLPDSLSNPLMRIDPSDADEIKREVQKDVKRDALRQAPPAAHGAPAAPTSAAPPANSNDDNGNGNGNGNDNDNDNDDEVRRASPAGGSTHAPLAKRLKNMPKEWANLPPDQQSRLMREKVSQDAPYAMFFLLPLFALLLKWMFRGNRLLYGAHLLFSLHLHCFAFLVLALGFLPLPGFGRALLQWVVVFYLFFALRRVYERGWGATAWRIGAIYALYGIAIGTTVLSGLMSAILGGAK